MNARKKESQMMKHPRMTKVFEERNTKQSQTLMELTPKDLMNASDWYAWSLYWNIVPLHVEKLHTLVKDLDDKLDEKEAVVSRRNLIDWVIEYRDRRQALLFCVDFMLGLTNEETQRQLSRSVTEWEECFVKMEWSWGYWFPDVKQILKCPIDGTTALKQSQVANRTSTDAAMRCPRTRKLRQSRVHQAKQSCLKKTASEKESLTRSRRTNEQEPCCVKGDSVSEMENPVNDETSLPEEKVKVSDKTDRQIQMDNRATVSSKESNEERSVLQTLMKAEDQKSDEFPVQRSELESLQIEELGKHPQLAEIRSNRSSVISKTSSARRVFYSNAKAQKEQEELQTRLKKLKREAIEREIADLYEELARKARIAEKERQIAEATCSQGTSFQSIASVESFTEDSRWTDKTETAENGTKSNIAVSAHSKLENAVKLAHEGKFSAPMRDSKSLTKADERVDRGNRTKADKGAYVKGATSQPEVNVGNKGISKLPKAESIQNWSETIIVDNGRQDFRSETFLVDTKHVVEEEIHLVISDHSIVLREQNLKYTMTETRKEHRSLTFSLGKQSSKELSVQLELLLESAEVITVQHDVQQGKLFEVTMFHDSTLLLEEGNKKCFDFVKSYGIVNEQQFALQKSLNEEVMCQQLCHVAMKHDKPVKGNEGETQAMNTSFGKKFHFDFKVSFVEDTIPSENNVWNLWIGNGNSGMDAVAQANGIVETQLSKGHRKRPKKRAWKIEPLSNLIHGMTERTQLNENGIQKDTVWFDLIDKSSVTRTQMCSLEVPTTESWSGGSCKGPAAPFKTMWTQNGTFGKLEVSYDLVEPRRNPDAKKLEFCGERSWVTFYKHKRKRNSKALQLLEENMDVDTEYDVSEGKKQNEAQQLSSERKFFFRCRKNTENKRENFNGRNVGNSLYLLIMIIVDSSTFQELQIQIKIMEILENEISLTYLPRGQSMLMMNCEAKQILGNWLEMFSTYSGNLFFGCRWELSQMK